MKRLTHEHAVCLVALSPELKQDIGDSYRPAGGANYCFDSGANLPPRRNLLDQRRRLLVA
ncbi:MAG: hypothetical protein ACXVRK_11200 [Gaiellaceae bacterium]